MGAKSKIIVGAKSKIIVGAKCQESVIPPPLAPTEIRLCTALESSLLESGARTENCRTILESGHASGECHGVHKHFSRNFANFIFPRGGGCAIKGF